MKHWFVWALLSAVFAGATAILAKVGIQGINSNLATALRTTVVLVFAWCVAAPALRESGLENIAQRTWLFLIASGLATGLSWLCYFRALQLGQASQVAPDQVRVITLSDEQALIEYAKPIVNELRANMVRVDADFSATPFKAKISNAEQLRVHTMLVIGGRDMESGAVSVRLHHGGPQGAKPKAEVVADILAAIKERRA